MSLFFIQPLRGSDAGDSSHPRNGRADYIFVDFAANFGPNIEGVANVRNEDFLRFDAERLERGVKIMDVGDFEDFVGCAHNLIDGGVLKTLAKVEWTFNAVSKKDVAARCGE